MNIVEIIPIARTTKAETLSYFTAENPPIGAIVDVPLRSKIIHGIVAAVRPAADMKADLKNAEFALKKIEKVKARQFLSPALMAAALAEADYAATTLGAALKAMVHESIFAESEKLIIMIQGEPRNHAIYALQGDDDERYGAYRSMIREGFARKKSLLFLAPTSEEAGYLKSVLEKGIEKYIFILHSGMTARKIRETWNAAAEERHPVVVVATGPFMFFMRSDLETMVIERESLRGWKSLRRPYLDLRHAAETYAEKAGLRLFIGDIAVRLETSRRVKKGEIDAGSPWKSRSVSSARDLVIDMKKYKDTYRGNASFRILSEETESLIRKTREENAHMIIVAARKGVAPTTVCADCQTLVTCTNCGAPVVLHEAKQARKREPGNSPPDDAVSTYFLCHHCGERRSSEEYCKNCGSWKLATVGIGIDLVKKKIVDAFPGTKVFELNSEAAPTTTKIHDTIEKFKATPGSILLGTELLATYFHDRVPYAAVITLDSLLSLPDFRITERLFSFLIRLRSLTERDFVIQTRRPEEATFEFAAKGNITDFVRHALVERKQFGWPPYSLLIKLSIEGRREDIARDMETLRGLVAPHEIEVFPSFTAGARGTSFLHGLIRLQPSAWPDAELLAKLRSLSPSVSINVDPEGLL
jgi:primosomal protein N' (replication factor Y)